MTVVLNREVAANRGFLCTILIGMRSGPKASCCYRQGGRLSRVAIKRGSTVYELCS